MLLQLLARRRKDLEGTKGRRLEACRGPTAPLCRKEERSEVLLFEPGPVDPSRPLREAPFDPSGRGHAPGRDPLNSGLGADDRPAEIVEARGSLLLEGTSDAWSPEDRRFHGMAARADRDGDIAEIGPGVEGQGLLRLQALPVRPSEAHPTIPSGDCLLPGHEKRCGEGPVDRLVVGEQLEGIGGGGGFGAG